MADKDLEIAMKTTGDTSGAEKIEKSLFKVEDAAKRAERAADVAEAKARKAAREQTGGLLGVDVTKQVDDLLGKGAEAAGFGKEFTALKGLIGADSAAIAGSFAAIGAAGVAAFKLLEGTAVGYRKVLDEAKAGGVDLGTDLEIQVQALEATLGPVTSTIKAVGDAWEEAKKVITDPIGEISGVNDLKESLTRAKEQAQLLKKAQIALGDENQTSVKSRYDAELTVLKDQEATLKRIASLRSEQASLIQESLAQEVDIAKQTGGDVKLAQANLLVAKLDEGLQKLAENLRSAQNSEEQARTQLDAALIAYNQGIQDNLNKLKPEEFSKLGNAVDAAKQELTDKQNENAIIRQNFEISKQTLLRGIDQARIELETGLQSEFSKPFEQVNNKIIQTLQENLGTTQTQAIQQINVAAGAVTDAANTQAAQVQAAVQTERAGTVTAIQGLTPTPQDTAAIVSAVKQVSEAQAARDNAIIVVLVETAAGINRMIARVNNQQAQIATLFSRIR